MSTQIHKHQWIYVVVQDPETNPQYLGQHDDEINISFIPIFIEKEDALMCLNLMARDKKKTHEVQAVIYEELTEHASTGGFHLYVLNKSGEVIEKINPNI
jgi:hypothetical protein